MDFDIRQDLTEGDEEAVEVYTEELFSRFVR
jgi:hypothetical protein